MIDLVETSCCAMKEIDNLSHAKTPEAALAGIRHDLHWDRPAFVIFTGVVKRRVADHASGRKDNYGKAFADYLTKNKFGTVYRGVRPVRNHHTDNHVKVWIWVPNYSKLKKVLES